MKVSYFNILKDTKRNSKISSFLGLKVQPIGDYLNCNFFTENFVRAFCGIETEIHDIIKQIIKPSDVVLEIGSR